MSISVFHGSDTRIAYQVTPQTDRTDSPTTFTNDNDLRFMDFNTDSSFGATINLGQPVPRIASNRIAGPRPFQNITAQIQINNNGSWLVDDWLLGDSMAAPVTAGVINFTTTSYFTVTAATSRSISIRWLAAQDTEMEKLETGSIVRMSITGLSNGTTAEPITDITLATTAGAVPSANRKLLNSRYFYVGAFSKSTASTNPRTATLHLFPNVVIDEDGTAMAATADEYATTDADSGTDGLRKASLTTTSSYALTTSNIQITAGNLEFKYFKTRGVLNSRTVVIKRGSNDTLQDTTNNLYRIAQNCYVTQYEYTIRSGGFVTSQATLATGRQTDSQESVGAGIPARPLQTLNSSGNAGGQLIYADNKLIPQTAVTSFGYSFQSSVTPFLRSGSIDTVAQSVDAIAFSANYSLAEQRTDPVADIINGRDVASFCYIQGYRGTTTLTDAVTGAPTSNYEDKLLIAVIPEAFFSETSDPIRTDSVLTKSVQLSGESLGVIQDSENVNGRLPRISESPVQISLI